MNIIFRDFETQKAINNSDCTRFFQLFKEVERRPELQKRLRYWPTQDKVLIVKHTANDMPECWQTEFLRAENLPIEMSFHTKIHLTFEMDGFRIELSVTDKHFSAKEILNRVELFLETAERFSRVLGNTLRNKHDYLYDVIFDISNPMVIIAHVDSREYVFEWTLSQNQMKTLHWTEVTSAYDEMLINRHKNNFGRYVYHFQKFHTYVEASSIWPASENHIDYGLVPDLVRGYNVQVQLSDGTLHWWSCEYIHGNPEDVFMDDFHKFMWTDREGTPTGRICFRGYGKLEWDPEERDNFVNQVSDDEVKKLLGII